MTPADRYLQGLAHYNAGEIAAYAAVFATDAVVQRPDGTFRGRTAITQLWTRELARFPDRELTILHLAAAQDLVMSEWIWTATDSGGQAITDGRRLPHTGRSIRLRGMEIVTLLGGLIVEYRMYWDHSELQRQLEWPAP